ncbi:MAG: hypothetical protein JWM85_453 [Acidimicrobiaceae bacterium]|nr:hypothetical protein [Acidimicrobiaceae bacterium]
MRLATVRYEGESRAAVLNEDRVGLLGAPDLGALLAEQDWSALAGRPQQEVAADDVTVLTLVPRPSKIMCIGLNYRLHIEEVGAEAPEYPTVFAKFARSLIGDGEPIQMPAISERLDWEVELVAVIGRTVRNASESEAEAAIAGFTVGNDVSARDLQNRTSQWLQGKTCEATTPVGPCMVTTDEVGTRPDLAIRCEVDGVLRQDSRTSDLLFSVPQLVAYLSNILTLDPGDIIFTGTPGGVGQGLKPPVFLNAGQTVACTIEGIGTLTNSCAPAGR